MSSSPIDYEKHLLPNGMEVLFYPESHTYECEGKTLLSVTTLLKNKYGDKYAAVPPDLLKRAADYGTAVHKQIQDLVEMRDSVLDDPEALLSESIDLFKYQEVENYFKLVEPIYKITPQTMEKVVLLFDESGVPAAAGRFDMYGTVDGAPTLIDIKTTSVINRQSVTAQLNLYLTAAQQSGYFDPSIDIKLGVVHLSGETGRFVPIPTLAKGFYKGFLPEGGKT